VEGLPFRAMYFDLKPILDALDGNAEGGAGIISDRFGQ
jgi:hypothetical protein